MVSLFPKAQKTRQFLYPNPWKLPHLMRLPSAFRSPPESSLSDDESSEPDDGDDGDERTRFAFPELDAQIRAAVVEYGAVFPKLNFSSPRVSLVAVHVSTYRGDSCGSC